MDLSSPNFNLLYGGMSPAEFILRKKESDQRAQFMNNQSQLGLARLMEDSRQYEQTRADVAPGVQLENQTKAANLAMLPQQAEMAQQESNAKVSGMYAKADKDKSEALLSKLGFISDKLGMIDNQSSLTRFNRYMIKSGLMSESQLPQTVEQAQWMHAGSKMSQIQKDFDNKLLEIDRQDISEEKKQYLQYQYAKASELQKQKFLRGMENTKFMNDIQLQRLKNKQGPSVSIQNILPEPKAAGGPVNAGQPYLVGEQGPEIIVPPTNGNVLTAEQTAAIQAAYGNPTSQPTGPQSAGASSMRPVSAGWSGPGNAMGTPGGPLNYSTWGDSPNQDQEQSSDASSSTDDLINQALAESDKANAVGLTKTQQSKVQDELIDLDHQEALAFDIMKNFDDKQFTTIGRYQKTLQGFQANVAPSSLSEEQYQNLWTARQQREQIGQLFNAYRKLITGAGAQLAELEQLKDTMLNNDLNPVDARSSMYSLYKNISSAKMARELLLKDGFTGGLQSKESQAAFSNYEQQFRHEIDNQVRQMVKNANEAWKKSGRPGNSGYDDLDAIKAIATKALNAKATAQTQPTQGGGQ